MHDVQQRTILELDGTDSLCDVCIEHRDSRDRDNKCSRVCVQRWILRTRWRSLHSMRSRIIQGIDRIRIGKLHGMSKRDICNWDGTDNSDSVCLQCWICVEHRRDSMQCM